MDPHGALVPEGTTEGKITMEQYLDLNVRLQKALNPDFDYEDACISAVEDWEIDAEDWEGSVSAGETQHPCTPSSNYAASESQPNSKIFTFDKFSDFLFETGEVWCDGSIEGILVIINSALLHISQGVHLTCSVFKDIEVISVLPDSLFEEISEMVFNAPPLQQDFFKWYQRNFLELDSMRKYVTEKIFNSMPEESRVCDLWANQQGYNQTDILIQCTNRLEGLLNRIKPGAPVAFPITDLQSKKKIMPNTSILPQITTKKKMAVPNLTQIRQENEPIVMQNKIIFTRNINLTLVGQAYTSRGKSQELTENIKNNEGISIVYNNSKDITVPKVSQIKPSVSQKIGPDMSPLHSDRSFAFENLFQNSGMKRPSSSPLNASKKIELYRSNSDLQLHEKTERKLFEENIDPEYTPKLKFNKTDVKYHGLQKSWRKGKFLKAQVHDNSPEVGEVNKRSPLEYYEAKKMHGKVMVEAYESIRQSKTQEYSRNNGREELPTKSDLAEKKDSIGSDDLERLIGIKISVTAPSKQDKSMKTTQNIGGNATKTAPAFGSRKHEAKAQGTVYTFEEFSHLIKQKNTQKLVFTDGLEFLYALNQAKHEFNTTHQSEFLKTYIKKNNEYRSRRDELGGFISSEDWKKFISHLEQIIKITKIRRKNRRMRRKKKGKLNRPRGGVNVTKNRLWRNVFIKPVNDERFNRERYLREIRKIDNFRIESLPQPLEQIINDSVKVPIPPAHPKQISKKRTYSPGRYRKIQK